MGHHFSAGLGNLVGPFLFQFYLPEAKSGGHDASKAADEVCAQDPVVSDPGLVGHESVSQRLNYADDIQGSFDIMALGHVICAIGYVLITLLPHEMPGDSDDEPDIQTSYSITLFSVFEESTEEKSKAKKAKSQPTVVLVIVVLFYMVSCGSERIYGTMNYVFGLCGPLKLAPQEAIKTDESYSGGFMIGR